MTSKNYIMEQVLEKRQKVNKYVHQVIALKTKKTIIINKNKINDFILMYFYAGTYYYLIYF